MKQVCLALACAGAIATNALATHALAQSALSQDQRINLASTFIGKSLLLDQVSKDCAVRFAEPPYDGQGALIKLRPYLSAEEYQFFWNYLQSDIYPRDRRHTETSFRTALDDAIAKGVSHEAACVSFAKTFLSHYEQAKAALNSLR